MPNLVLVCAITCMTACEEEEKRDEPRMPQIQSNYYTDIDLSGTADDFATINNAIKNNILIYSTGYSHNFDHYAAEMDYFFGNGMWTTSDSSYGKLRFLPSNGQNMSVIKFVDESSLVEFHGSLWDPDRVPKNYEIIGKIYTGEVFGTLLYCAEPYYYTYVKMGNKIIVSNGDLYTQTDSGLIKDGTSRPYIQYDPNKPFQINLADNTIDEGSDLHPVSGKDNGYEYVNLGLSVKWATFNIGATEVEEFGEYYAWGETQTKSKYDWSTYIWYNGSSSTIIKYNTLPSYGQIFDNKSVLELNDDVAHVLCGGKWRIPTDVEWGELRDESNCSWEWINMNGINGYKVRSKKEGYKDNWIFLPASGCFWGQAIDNNCTDAYYWSSSLYNNDPEWAIAFYISQNTRKGMTNIRAYGNSIRPVSD